MLLFLTILLAAGLLFWIVQSILLVWTLLVLPTLRPRHASGDDETFVSVIVPARNEQSVIEDAVRSRLADPDPALEFLLVDDRSTDSTGAIMDHLAATDARIRVDHVEQLPPGWLGKVHAMHVGAAHARGDWLLLSDADVHVAPGTVRAAVDLARDHDAVHVAGIPAIRTGSLGLNLCLAPMQRALILLFRMWAVHDPRSRAAMGVGAFNLVRRDAFEAAGGFDALRMEVIDDVGVGIMIKEHGEGTRAVFAAECLHLSWYDRFSDFIQGIERGMAKRPAWCPRWLLAVLVVLLTLLDLSPFLALLASLVWPGIAWVALPAAVWVLLLSLAVAIRFGTNPIFAALVPINTVFAGCVALRVVLFGGRDGRITWRGNKYEVDALRDGERIGFSRDATGESP